MKGPVRLGGAQGPNEGKDATGLVVDDMLDDTQFSTMRM